MVKSPGVPNDAPVIAAARERGIDVVGELELAWRAIPNRFVAVTGTNGKTTTTELLGEIYRVAGEPVAVAGNVGTPLASLAGEAEAEATVVCECSSFQLEDAIAFAPECAVFLNLAPDHLDRHPTDEEYLAAKLRIFAKQGNDDVAVFNGDEPALAGSRPRRLRAAGPLLHRRRPRLRGLPGAGDDLPRRRAAARGLGAAARRRAQRRQRDGGRRRGARDGPRSRCGARGPADLRRRSRTGSSASPSVGGVRFYNDSKATNVSAAAAALRVLRRRRARDPRRQAEGRVIRAASPIRFASVAPPAI